MIFFSGSCAQDVVSINSDSDAHLTAEHVGSDAVQIKADHSKSTSETPLYIIDGILISSGSISSFSNSAGMDIFNSLNPEDIKEVLVLKGEDATSDYGPRAAYGVVIATTKKGNSVGLKSM